MTGLSPADPLDLAHAMQFTMMAMDCLTEAESAYHPISKPATYVSQAEAAEPVIQEYLKSRLPRFLGNLENSLKANTKSEDWAIGESLTFADAVLFQLIRGYKTSQREHYAANESIPLIKAHTLRMYNLPAIVEFMASDRSTKME